MTEFVDSLRFIRGPQPETVKIVDADCAGGYRWVNTADLTDDDVLFEAGEADEPKPKKKGK